MTKIIEIDVCFWTVLCRLLINENQFPRFYSCLIVFLSLTYHFLIAVLYITGPRNPLLSSVCCARPVYVSRQKIRHWCWDLAIKSSGLDLDVTGQ